jgi:DNA-directed RNA polymerase specialized sigma24 family protein
VSAHPQGDIAAVIAVLGPDLTATEWARVLGASLLDVRAVADSQGVTLADAAPRRGSRILTATQEEVVALAFRGGMAARLLAEAFGIHEDTVYRLAKEAA